LNVLILLLLFTRQYKSMNKQILLFLCMASALALFSDDSAVFKLTAANFKEQVINSEDFWLVEFYGTSIFTQLPGADTARGRLLSSKKPQKS
jgi:hypothetical protein